MGAVRVLSSLQAHGEHPGSPKSRENSASKGYLGPFTDLGSPFCSAVAGVKSTRTCQHLLDTALLESLQNNEYRAKGPSRVVYCGKITPSESHSDHSNTRADPPPARRGLRTRKTGCEWKEGGEGKKRNDTPGCRRNSPQGGERHSHVNGGHGRVSLGQACGKLWLLIFVFSEKYLKRARRGLKLRTQESEREHARGSWEQVAATPELFLENERNTRRKNRKRWGDFCVTESGDAFPPRCVLSPARALCLFPGTVAPAGGGGRRVSSPALSSSLPDPGTQSGPWKRKYPIPVVRGSCAVRPLLTFPEFISTEALVQEGPHR